jgi:hypothetical protein
MDAVISVLAEPDGGAMVRVILADGTVVAGVRLSDRGLDDLAGAVAKVQAARQDRG